MPHRHHEIPLASYSEDSIGNATQKNFGIIRPSCILLRFVVLLLYYHGEVGGFVRRLMWFVLGFGPACAVYTYLFPERWALPIAAVLLLLSVGWSILGRRRKWAGRVCAVCLGLALGMLYCWGYDGLRLSSVRQLDGYEGTVTLELTQTPTQGTYSTICQGNLTAEGVTAKAIVYVNGLDGTPTLGDRIIGSGTLRWTSDGGSGEPSYHRSNGVLLICYMDAGTVAEGRLTWRHWPALARQRLSSLLERIFPKDARGFVKALILGDKSGLSQEISSDLSAAGLSHMVAVSGMHLSILFSALYFLLGKQKKWAILLEMTAAIFFAAMVGFTPSVTRAAIMQCIMLGAILLKREYDPPTSLAAAALLILAVNPMAASSISFQLSFGAVAGIFLVSGKLNRYFRKLLKIEKGKHKVRKALCGSVSMTLGALLFTTPLTAIHFGSVSLVSVLSNCLTVAAVSVLFQLALVACFLGAIFLPLGQAVGWAAAWLVRYILLVARAMASIPGGLWYTGSFLGILWLVFAYVMLVVFCLGGCKKPVVLVCCLCLSWGVCTLGGLFLSMERSFRVSVLDVGQGQCVLLQFGGKAYLVDCGGDYAADAAIAALGASGIYRLDGLILTHYDRDHCDGAAELLYRVPADLVYLPVAEDAGGFLPEIQAAAAGMDICWVSQDVTIQTENAKLQVFAPMGAASDNDNCLTCLLSVGEFDTLITGDLSTTGELRLIYRQHLPDVELLIVGHHGSASSTGMRLLEAVTPETAVISVGENSYGHPAAATLSRLESVGCQVYRTDQQGTIIIER